MKRKAGKKANVVAKKKAKASIAEFNKSPFVLQCDDLLAENSFAASVVEESEKFAASIIKILRTGKLQGKHPLVDTKWMQESGVVFPLKIDQKLIERMKSSSLDFEFKKPQQAEIVGDWKSGAALKSLDPEILIDVQMSQEYFGPRDHLNFIYHVRRAHYASACAVILGKALKNATLSFVTNSDAPWNPDILVERSVEGTDVVPKTRITFSVSTEAPFALMSRLTSEKNCVRSSFVQGKVSKKEQDQDDVATPFYNRSIVMDLCWRNLRAKLTGFLNGNEVALKAYKLLKLWAARSDLFKRSDGISKETLAYLLVYLDQKQIISDKMELTTLLTNFWTWLVEKNFQEAISLKEDADIAIFEGASKYVFVDPEGHVNLVASMSVPALGRISREASRALRMLPSLDSFHNIFVTPLSFSLIYDQYITVTLPVSYKKTKEGSYFLELLQNGGNWLRIFASHYVPTIIKGWTDRIPYFDITSEESDVGRKWSVGEARKDSSSTPAKIVLGLELQGNWNSPLTRGPVANSAEGFEFQKFWGKRSQLRKFADNTICEAVVWAEDADSTIPVSALRYVLEKHFDLPEAATLNSVLPANLLADPAHFDKINQAYDQLSKHLRNAKNLPLCVSNITPVSPCLRKTDPFPPVAGIPAGAPTTDESKTFALPDILKDTVALTPSVDVKITLEKSGRWADDIPAIAKLKTAFYIEIGRALREQFSLRCYPQKERLFIIMEKSIVFALEIVCPKEITILKKVAGKKEGIPKDSAASRQLEKETVYRPQMCSSLTSTSNQFASFGETCQLVRQWISSQYLLDQFDPIVIELLVAHVYLNPIGFAPPLTAYKGFVHFLHLLVDQNWLMKPLFVDFTKSWTYEDIHVLNQNFLKMRAVLPPVVIITPDNAIGSRFTRGLPQPVVLKRMIALAKHALNMIFASDSGANLASFFHSTTSAYDAVISIDSKHIAERLRKKPKNSPKSSKPVFPIVDFDPVEMFMGEVKAAFDGVAYFFHDKFRPNKIGIVWKPVGAVKELNITNCLHRQLKNGKVLLNREAILEDIRIMGIGLIEDITTK